MAVVTSDFLAGVLTNFRATFQDSFDAARNLAAWPKIAMEVQSNGLVENHSWLGTVPQMVDVTRGDSQMEGLFSFNYALTNRTWKAQIEVERAVFEDDQIGMLTPRLRQLGEEGVRHPGQLILQLFETNGNAFDGAAFFADTRVIGRSANIDNIQTQTGVTIANIQTDLAVVRARLRTFQDDQGRPMNNVLNTIICNPDIEQTMYQALSIGFPAAAPTASNIQPAGDLVTVNGYTIITNPYITTAGDWYGCAVTPSMKPFIYQSRVAPTLEDQTLGSEDAVKRDRFVYGVRARYEVGYGDPRYAIRVT